MDIFCQANKVLRNQIIEETNNFLLLHDGYPLLEGHLLIIPKKHIVCFLEIDKKIQREYFEIKNKVSNFLETFYCSPIFFEHGGIAQTLSHAHIHALPTNISIRKEIEKIGVVMKIPVIPYLFYEEKSKTKYYFVNKTIKDGFLHNTYALKLKRPLIGKKRAVDLQNWLPKIKNNWKKNYVSA